MEPQQKPGRSKQDYGTPAVFLDAVLHYIGAPSFEFDFACTEANAKGENYFLDGVDSLQQDWSGLIESYDWGWLNPPFAKIAPWVKKAHGAAKEGVKIAVLVPAAVGSNWWRDHVNGVADVLFLNGRITFDGTPINPKTGKPDPFPKDCALLFYEPDALVRSGSYDVWTWKQRSVLAASAEILTHPEGKAHASAGDRP